MAAMPRRTTTPRVVKSSRLELRITPEQKNLLEEAAAAGARSVTDFVLESASAAAHDVLADRSRFVLSPEKWSELSAAMDRPARIMPDLATFLAEPSVLEK